VRDKRRYIFSALGIIDLLAILPAYVSFFLHGLQSPAAERRSMRRMRCFAVGAANGWGTAGRGELPAISPALRLSGRETTLAAFSFWPGGGNGRVFGELAE